METEQTMLVESTPHLFEFWVNVYLKKGWKIVPGTMAIKDCCYICVLERSKQPERA